MSLGDIINSQTSHSNELIAWQFFRVINMLLNQSGLKWWNLTLVWCKATRSSIHRELISERLCPFALKWGWPFCTEMPVLTTTTTTATTTTTTATTTTTTATMSSWWPLIETDPSVLLNLNLLSRQFSLKIFAKTIPGTETFLNNFRRFLKFCQGRGLFGPRLPMVALIFVYFLMTIAP